MKIIFDFFLIVLIVSCSKIETENEIWYVYNETLCNDKWNDYPHESDIELSNAVRKYLYEKDILVNEIIIYYEELPPCYCTGCSVKTGRFIELSSSGRNETLLNELGFKVL